MADELIKHLLRQIPGVDTLLETDAVRDALQLEAKRAAAALRGNTDAPLYYLAYRVRDGSTVNMAASFGSVGQHRAQEILCRYSLEFTAWIIFPESSAPPRNSLMAAACGIGLAMSAL